MDVSTLKMGRLPYVPKAKDLLFANYIADAGRLIEAAQVPAAPNLREMLTPSGERPTRDPDPLGNTRKGCCVFSGIAHQINLAAKLSGRDDIVVTEQMVLDEYDRRTGGVDNGYVIRDMLGIGQREGLWGVKIEAYTLIGADPTEQAIATHLGCGIIGGYSLPVHSQTAVDAQGKTLWTIPDGGLPEGDYPGKWGRHCIHGHAASPGLNEGNSWGDDETAWLRPWDEQCGDERWFVLLHIWQGANGRAPNGFAWEDLLADVRARTA
jgi:hypothetical protein